VQGEDFLISTNSTLDKVDQVPSAWAARSLKFQRTWILLTCPMLLPLKRQMSWANDKSKASEPLQNKLRMCKTVLKRCSTWSKRRLPLWRTPRPRKPFNRCKLLVLSQTLLSVQYSVFSQRTTNYTKSFQGRKTTWRSGKTSLSVVKFWTTCKGVYFTSTCPSMTLLRKKSSPFFFLNKTWKT